MHTATHVLARFASRTRRRTELHRGDIVHSHSLKSRARRGTKSIRCRATQESRRPRAPLRTRARNVSSSRQGIFQPTQRDAGIPSAAEAQCNHDHSQRRAPDSCERTLCQRNAHEDVHAKPAQQQRSQARQPRMWLEATPAMHRTAESARSAGASSSCTSRVRHRPAALRDTQCAIRTGRRRRRRQRERACRVHPLQRRERQRVLAARARRVAAVGPLVRDAARLPCLALVPLRLGAPLRRRRRCSLSGRTEPAAPLRPGVPLRPLS